MSLETIAIGENFACTLGLAVFSGVAGKRGEHAHWTHQIVVDLDGKVMECFCDNQWFRSRGVFVPAGHEHSVDPGNQISLFFDTEIDWIAEMFGGELDTSCASVLDQDVLLGIRTCFHEKMDLKEGLEILAQAFEMRIRAELDPVKSERWVNLMDQVKSLEQQSHSDTEKPYSMVGALFAADQD